MPTVTVTGSRPATPGANVFWIAANVMFDLGTGEKKEILLLVNRLEDATAFTQPDATNYAQFVAQRATNIRWVVEKLTSSVFDRYVVKGVQYVG